jgi:hypothetical protein
VVRGPQFEKRWSTATVYSSLHNTQQQYTNRLFCFHKVLYHTELINPLTASNISYHSIFLMSSFCLNTYRWGLTHPRQLKFVPWCTGLQFQACFMLPFWHRQFWGGGQYSVFAQTSPNAQPASGVMSAGSSQRLSSQGVVLTTPRLSCDGAANGSDVSVPPVCVCTGMSWDDL